MTDWDVGDLSLDRWVEDLELVADAAAPGAPMVLLGISQGAATCIAYAVRHPERVSHLVLYGGYSRGTGRRGDTQHERIYSAIIELARLGWGQDNPAFRQVFTSRFIPDGTDEQIGWFNELCLKTTSPENAARLLESRAQIDVVDLLPQVRTPTLVLHARQDGVTPFDEGRRLASGIPGAQFVELDSKNHVLLENEPAWERFQEAVLDFVGVSGAERRGPGVQRALVSRARDPRARDARDSATPRSPSGSRSARRPCATTSRTCSTSSACGRARRRSCSRATAASATDAGRTRSTLP